MCAYIYIYMYIYMFCRFDICIYISLCGQRTDNDEGTDNDDRTDGRTDGQSTTTAPRGK